MSLDFVCLQMTLFVLLKGSWMGLSSVGLCRHVLTAHEVVDDGIDGAIEVEEPVGDTHGRLLQLATELILLPPVLSQSRPETQSGP